MTGRDLEEKLVGISNKETYPVEIRIKDNNSKFIVANIVTIDPIKHTIVISD